MTLPATIAEAQAIEFAKERLRRVNAGDFFDPGYSAFHPEAGRILLRRMMRDFASCNTDAMLALINQARAGWDDADLAVRAIITEYLNRGETLPTSLAAYNTDVINGYVARAP